MDSPGYVTVTIIMIMSLLLLLGTAAMALAVQHHQMAIRHYYQTRAYYIAEAGVHMVLADRDWLSSLKIVPDYKERDQEYRDPGASYYPDPLDGDYVHEFGGGTVIIKVIRKQNTPGQARMVFRIYATGIYNGNTRVLDVLVRVPFDGSPVERVYWQEKYPLF
ncbi:MAG TPA: hypothetical protein GXX25_00375 [Desulfotomaculum sp.]|nr:hypothetical protein [Desulfotomaculum sp.]